MAALAKQLGEPWARANCKESSLNVGRHALSENQKSGFCVLTRGCVSDDCACVGMCVCVRVYVSVFDLLPLLLLLLLLRMFKTASEMDYFACWA